MEDIPEGLRTFLFTLETTRSSSSMAKWRAGTVCSFYSLFNGTSQIVLQAVKAFQWADYIDLLVKKSCRGVVLDEAKQFFPAQAQGMYTDVSEVVHRPAETVLRAVLSSPFLSFSESKGKVFQACLVQSKLRIGEKRTTELLVEIVGQKLLEKRQRVMGGLDPLIFLAKDLLVGFHCAMSRNTQSRIDIYGELEAHCAQHYVLFIVATRLISENIFAFVPLSLSEEELEGVLSIRKAVGDVVWRLALSDPLRLVPDSKDVEQVVNSWLFTLSREHLRTLGRCIHESNVDEGSQPKISKLASLMGQY